MLTDMIVEEEFELKDEEPWYGKQDLEHGKRLVLPALRPKQPKLREDNHQPLCHFACVDIVSCVVCV